MKIAYLRAVYVSLSTMTSKDVLKFKDDDGVEIDLSVDYSGDDDIIHAKWGKPTKYMVDKLEMSEDVYQGSAKVSTIHFDRVARIMRLCDCFQIEGSKWDNVIDFPQEYVSEIMAFLETYTTDLGQVDTSRGGTTTHKYVVKSSRKRARESEQSEKVDLNAAAEKKARVDAANPPPEGRETRATLMQELKNLKQLHDDGILDAEDYSRLKNACVEKLAKSYE